MRYGYYDPSCPAQTVNPGNSPTGAWLYDWTKLLAGDGITKTISLYGTDAAGNRSTGLNETFRIDTVAPVITLTAQISNTALITPAAVVPTQTAKGGKNKPGSAPLQQANATLPAQNAPIMAQADASNLQLSGVVSDGGIVASMSAIAFTSDGQILTEDIPFTQTSDNQWSWTYTPGITIDSGTQIYITAQDFVGNVSTIGPFGGQSGGVVLNVPLFGRRFKTGSQNASAPTPEVTETITETPEVTDTATLTPIVTDTPTITPIVTDTPTLTPVVSETPTLTPIASETPTETPTLGATPTETLVSTETPTLEPTATETPPASETPNTCAVAPNAVTLTSPANNDTMPRRRVQLKWNAVDCADSYHVIVTEKKSGDVVADVPNLTDTQYRTDQLDQGKRYSWKVIAVNSAGETTSEEWLFRIAQDAGQ